MVARLNDERMEQGLPALGFLNPLLYRLAQLHPEAFNDVVIGDNRCSAARCCQTGFGASRGWDAVTGHGSPNLPVLMKLLQPGAFAAGEADAGLGVGFAALSRRAVAASSRHGTTAAWARGLSPAGAFAGASLLAASLFLFTVRVYCRRRTGGAIRLEGPLLG